jgi:hypothetical protein
LTGCSTVRTLLAVGTPERSPPLREHGQAMYDRVIAWYEDAERKAQLILTLDGVFVSFLSASVFKTSKDLRATTSSFGAETWALLGLMVVSLTVSIASAVIALRSRLYTRAELEDWFDHNGVKPSDETTYSPAVTWFFQDLANLQPEVLARAMRRVDADVAIATLAENVVPLARNVVRKHRWVNRGFFFFGLVLLFFLGAAVSDVSRA